jgi:hypothetical protein
MGISRCNIRFPITLRYLYIPVEILYGVDAVLNVTLYLPCELQLTTYPMLFANEIQPSNINSNTFSHLITCYINWSDA